MLELFARLRFISVKDMQLDEAVDSRARRSEHARDRFIRCTLVESDPIARRGQVTRRDVEYGLWTRRVFRRRFHWELTSTLNNRLT